MYYFFMVIINNDFNTPENPNNIVDVTAYYLGGKTNSKGIFECSFMIEEPGVPKDEWLAFQG